MLNFDKASSLLLPALEQQPTKQGGHTHLGSAARRLPSSHRRTSLCSLRTWITSNQADRAVCIFQSGITWYLLLLRDRMTVCPLSLFYSYPCLLSDFLDTEYGEDYCFLKMEETSAWTTQNTKREWQLCILAVHIYVHIYNMKAN